MLATPKRLAGVKKAAHGRSAKQEAELAGRLGGKRVKGSGCGFDKGDVRVKGVALIEAKTTEKKSYALSREVVRKIEDAATSSGEIPALVIEFIDSKGKPEHRLAIMPMWALEMLVGKDVTS